MATSCGGRLRDGSGRRALSPRRAGGSALNVTSSSGSPESARTEAVTARLNGSEGFSGFDDTVHPFGLRHQNLGGAFRQVLAEAALIELGDRGALEFVALV